ncbi:urea ABC transporter substrate-binding protein [Halonotius roseus]|uniref:Urea ABC transporter substrate-binding protein n=1 Tax=Halonotius roseus TaxID=2511997 RepID=A0A544QNR1_9EURY|nr:urea ABC transporter substrate-binding protein [Halonotius roseus]TQQ80549.1 urea ABC transporter substrate-binding protein [Halonotius roseus]
MSENKQTRRKYIATTATIAGAGLAGCTGGTSSGSANEDDPIKIGVLEDQSGRFATIGKPKWQASKLAIDEINSNGGINGRQIELFDPDPQSDANRYQQLTERLITQENVDALIATYASPHREAIRPIVDRNEQLYFYTTQYEGGVCDSYTFCTGATARQQIEHVVTHLLNKYDAETIYTVAPDYNFGQISADWVEIIAQENDAEVIDEEFIPSSNSQFGSTISNISEADPDIIMSFLTGQFQTSFFSQRASAGLSIPIGTSITMAQAYEHTRFDPPALEDVHVATNYMQEMEGESAVDYRDAFQSKFPDAPYVNQESQNNYFTLYLYKKAVEEAGTTDQQEVISTLEEGMSISAPEGELTLDGETHHMSHNMNIARADENHNISFSNEEMIQEQFLSQTVGCDLTSTEETEFYTPSEFFDL